MGVKQKIKIRKPVVEKKKSYMRRIGQGMRSSQKKSI